MSLCCFAALRFMFYSPPHFREGEHPSNNLRTAHVQPVKITVTEYQGGCIPPVQGVCPGEPGRDACCLCGMAGGFNADEAYRCSNPDDTRQ
jgi:hypothetical protein